jgi:type VI secretion system VasD/TssJ family lipoprotein
MLSIPQRLLLPQRLFRQGMPLLLTASCLAIASCAPPSVEVRALPPVNTNTAGESLPVKIRIYALRDDARFRSAPFADLWSKDREVLGDDRLQDPKVVVVGPTGLRTDPQMVELSELPREARFLGVVALIQHADQPDRRRVIIARNDIGSQVIEVLDSSIVMHTKGDPLPGRPLPQEKPAPAAPAPAPAPAKTAAAAPAPAASAPPPTGSAPASSPANSSSPPPAGNTFQPSGSPPVRGRTN